MSTDIYKAGNIARDLRDENNYSGHGKLYSLPPDVGGWSWGCFFLNWVWAAAHGAWLAFVPLAFSLGILWWAYSLQAIGKTRSVYLGIFFSIGYFLCLAVPIVLGMRGREWAWRNKYWDSVEHFQRVQKNWSIAGLIIGSPIVLFLLLLLGFGVFMQVKQTQVVKNSNLMKTDLEIAAQETQNLATQLGSYISLHNEIPASLAAANIDTALASKLGTTEYDLDTAEITLRFTTPEYKNARFVFGPSFARNGSIEWRCVGTGLRSKKMPALCNHDVAEKPDLFPVSLRIQRALVAVKPASSALGAIMQKTKMVPGSLHAAGINPVVGKDFTTLKLDNKTGMLSVEMRDAPLANLSFYLEPMLTKQEKIVWRCRSKQIPREYLPPRCKYDVRE